MTNITVNLHINEWDRPISESIRALGIRLRDVNAQYHISGGSGDLVYAAALGDPNEPLDDGRSAAEGLPVITANDFLALEQEVIEPIQAIIDAKASLIQKFCVRSIQAS